MTKKLIFVDIERRNFPTANQTLRKAFNRAEAMYFDMAYPAFFRKIKRMMSHENCVVIAIDKEAENMLRSHGINYKILTDYYSKEEYQGFDDRVFEFIRSVNTKFPKIDHVYKGVSLWEVDEANIYESFFWQYGIFIEILKKIIAEEKPSEIVVFDKSSRFSRIIASFKDKVKITTKFSFLSTVKRFAMSLLTPFAVRLLSREFFKQISHSSVEATSKGSKVAFFASDRGLNYVYNGIKHLEKDLVVLQDEPYRIKNPNFSYESLNCHITTDSKKAIELARVALRKKYSKLDSSASGKFLYDGLDIYPAFDDMFAYLFIFGYLKSIYYCEAFNHFLSNGNVKLMIVMCHAPKSQRINLHLCKKYGIKTLLLQHGAYGYHHFYDNVDVDKYAVFGKFEKDLLVKQGNNSKIFAITGNPAWDNIFDEANSIDAHSALSIPKGKKIVLLATVHFPYEERNKLFFSVIKAIRNMPNVYLIIKTHPEERPDFYVEELAKAKMKATVLSDVKYLHPLILISDVVIVSNSTVGLHALIFGKPLIDVNLTGSPYYHDYVKDNVAFEARTDEELSAALKSALNDSKKIAKMREFAKKYVRYHAYKMDGKANDRVRDVIDRML